MKFKIKPAALIMIILMLFAFTACEDGGTGTSGPTTYAIGDTGPSGVGIVFYTTDSGLHGMEVAPYDQSSSAAWFTADGDIPVGFKVPNTEVGTGSVNTDHIINTFFHSGSAAQICRDYRGGGLMDWFLPSRDELNLIWDNLVDDGFGNNGGFGDFAIAIYWSSSSISEKAARYQDFYTGVQYVGSITSPGKVRAVRSF